MNDRQSRILETAADWVDRQGGLSAQERRVLQAWIDAAPEHAQAFAQMTRLMTDTALIDALEGDRAEATLPAMRVNGHSSMSPRVSRWHAKPSMLGRREAIAAGIAGAIAGALAIPAAGYWLLHPEASDRGGGDPALQRIASAVGRRRHVTLPDGSAMLLDAASRVAVNFAEGRRAVVLKQGAARFDVRHDPERPFEVSTPHGRMTALGTSFAVDHLADVSELRVFSGRVGLAAISGEQLVVPARQWATADAHAIVGRGSFDPAGGDWQTDWLDARAMPLGQAVERLSRYSASPLRLADARLAALTFSGRFRLDRPEASLTLIGALFGLELQRKDGALYLHAPGTALPASTARA